MYTSGAHARDPRVPIRQSRTGPRTAHSCHCIQRPQQQVHPQVQRGVQQQRASRRKLRSCAGRTAHTVRAHFGRTASSPSDAGETPRPRVCGRNRHLIGHYFTLTSGNWTHLTNQNKSAEKARHTTNVEFQMCMILPLSLWPNKQEVSASKTFYLSPFPIMYTEHCLKLIKWSAKNWRISRSL